MVKIEVEHRGGLTKKKIMNIIFDWSGVVKDVVKVQLWIINRMFTKLGIKEISMEELMENWEQPHMLFYNKYLPNLNEEEQGRLYREALFREDCPVSEPYPGVVELIKKLKEEGSFLAVISADLEETIIPEIKRYGLENIFEDIFFHVHDKTTVTRELIGKRKLNKDETFFIGDTNQEIEAGRENGIRTIAVTWGICTEKNLKLKNPDFIVHNTEELSKLILK
jgi:phosphoglycolate phosphatase-like HAD superfamily hydrolase